MGERLCAFTGRKATAKLRFPETDPHTWIEVPCCKHYKALRNDPKLVRREKELAAYFLQMELARADFTRVGFSDRDHERFAGWQRDNAAYVEHEMAELQKEHDAQVEEDLKEQLKERLKGLS